MESISTQPATTFVVTHFTDFTKCSIYCGPVIEQCNLINYVAMACVSAHVTSSAGCFVLLRKHKGICLSLTGVWNCTFIRFTCHRRREDGDGAWLFLWSILFYHNSSQPSVKDKHLCSHSAAFAVLPTTRTILFPFLQAITHVSSKGQKAACQTLKIN